MTTSPPFDRLVEDWIASQRSKHTRTQYRTTATQWLEWLAARAVAPLAATRRDGDDWRTEMQRRGRASRTINARLAGVASLYDYLVDQGLLAASPVKRVKREPVDTDQGETAALDEPQAAAILDAAAAAGPRTHAAVALLLLTAIRADELLTMDVSTVRIEGDVVTVRVDRKGGKRDVLPLTDQLADHVQSLAAGRKAGPLIHHQTTGAPWTYDQLHHAVMTAGVRAGIPEPVTPHVLRTTWATLAIAAAVPLADVQDVMGHASADTTRRYDRRRHDVARKGRAISAVEGVLRALASGRPKETP